MPGRADACGHGISAEFGASTEVYDFTGPGTVSLKLTFPDGSTLVLDETLVSFSFPGSSIAHEPPFSFGHPETSQSSYVVAGATGTPAGATGGGTDNFNDAGNVAFDAQRHDHAVTVNRPRSEGAWEARPARLHDRK